MREQPCPRDIFILRGWQKTQLGIANLRLGINSELPEAFVVSSALGRFLLDFLGEFVEQGFARRAQ